MVLTFAQTKILAKHKLERFAEVATFSNVFQHGYEGFLKGHPTRGKWNSDYFNNDKPIVLELGCGKGEYTVGLAEKFPEKNFIGIDIKGNRLWKGAKYALETNLLNVAFVRTRIDFIESVFAQNEISEIWITFPDPHPPESREMKRLSGPAFLVKYKNILKPKGIIHLKTDSLGLHEYTVALCKALSYPIAFATQDLYSLSPSPDEMDLQSAQTIQTYYEGKFRSQGIKITYLQFQFEIRNQ